MKKYKAWIRLQENKLHIEEVDSDSTVLGMEATDHRGRYYYNIGETEIQAIHNLRAYIRLKATYFNEALDTLTKEIRFYRPDVLNIDIHDSTYGIDLGLQVD